jgi:streptogramin lyase
MVYDSRRNCIWINSGDGLLRFTLHDKKFHRIGVFDEWIKSKDYDRWVGVDLDTQGQVWLATVPKGIIIYNPADGSVKPLFADNPDLQKTVAEGNMRIYCDKEGIVWLSYWLRKGFYQLNPVSQAVTRYNIDTAKSSPLYSNDVFNCTYAGNGKLWIGTGRGLYVFDAYSRVLQPSRKSIDGLILHIDTAKKRALIEDGRHFKEVDMRTLQDKPIILDDTGFYRAPDNTNKYLSAVPYKDGYILRTIYNEQVHFFFWRGSDAVAKKILAFPLANVVGHFFNTDGEKYLFLLSTTAGTTLTYTLENGRWVKKSTPLDSVKPRALYYNVQDGTYWLTAGNQLMRYSSDFRLIRRYIAEDVSSADAIHSILPDTYGNIWFHTDRFIYTLDVVKGRFYRLQERDGFQKQNFTPPFLPGSDNLGNLYFPSGWQYGEGFDLVSPDKLRNVYPHASVYIQNLEVAQKPYASRLGVNGISSLSLKHFQNAIVIQTGILDFYSKGKGRIRYKLDGVNNDWQYAPAYYTIRYDGLAPGNYKLLIQASNAVGDFNGPINSLQIGIAPPLWGTWWFQIIAAVVIVAVVYGVMRWRLHHLYQHRLQQSVKEKQLAELQRQKTDLEMQAMRAQMNPHFIFNSLNSINRFILQNNREQASDYLIKFSRLVRLILQHSQESLISLENELEALRLYLELEALRFNYHFSYKISLPEDVDAALIKVPPLIVQPYVENAIWHGLMHKEEQGQLDIDLSHEAGFLYFKITDNGIGRQQAALLRTKSATRHESVGHKITTHRIALMQQAAAKEPFVFINDLMDANGCAAGTEVLIKMPLLYD